MLCKKSEEPIVAMTAESRKHRTCIAGCRGRLCEDKTLPSKGVPILVPPSELKNVNFSKKNKKQKAEYWK